MIPKRYPASSSRHLGVLGESIAADFLKEKGYFIREKNFRCKIGEIDLIADRNEYLVFVEVKSRYAGKMNISPLISMTKAKCKKLRILGELYLVQKKLLKRQPRFDVIGISFQDKEHYTLEHIKNAF
ncbi:YraN family protein [bacterium]|nr:YraN family protein [bacterium]